MSRIEYRHSADSKLVEESPYNPKWVMFKAFESRGFPIRFVPIENESNPKFNWRVVCDERVATASLDLRHTLVDAISDFSFLKDIYKGKYDSVERDSEGVVIARVGPYKDYFTDMLVLSNEDLEQGVSLSLTRRTHLYEEILAQDKVELANLLERGYISAVVSIQNVERVIRESRVAFAAQTVPPLAPARIEEIIGKLVDKVEKFLQS